MPFERMHFKTGGRDQIGRGYPVAMAAYSIKRKSLPDGLQIVIRFAKSVIDEMFPAHNGDIYAYVDEGTYEENGMWVVCFTTVRSMGQLKLTTGGKSSYQYVIAFMSEGMRHYDVKAPQSVEEVQAEVREEDVSIMIMLPDWVVYHERNLKPRSTATQTMKRRPFQPHAARMETRLN